MQSNQMCDDDNIDDVLEKVTIIGDALQELFQTRKNQESLRRALAQETSEKKRSFRDLCSSV